MLVAIARTFVLFLFLGLGYLHHPSKYPWNTFYVYITQAKVKMRMRGTPNIWEAEYGLGCAVDGTHFQVRLEEKQLFQLWKEGALGNYCVLTFLLCVFLHLLIHMTWIMTSRRGEGCIGERACFREDGPMKAFEPRLG